MGKTTRNAILVLALLILSLPLWSDETFLDLNLQQYDPASGVPTQIKEKLVTTKAAIVVVDMWDQHWCKTYTARVSNLVPRMNQTLEAARKLGIPIVFAPSDVVGFYAEYPQRKAMQTVPSYPLPEPNTFEPPPQPVGRDRCECGPDQPCPAGVRVWTRQHKDLVLAENDVVIDCNNAREMLNFCRHNGIDTLIYMGVASNMCVLNRECGMVNMKRYGLKTLFVSDLVEAITANGIDPASREIDRNFTPAKGSAVIQRYIEQHIAPSFESRQLLAAAGVGSRDRRPHIVFVMAEQEYKSEVTLPTFAQRHLGDDFRYTFLTAESHKGAGRNNVPGLDALYDADLLVLSMRRRALPVTQMDHLERFIRAGKPLVALRVSVVPFQLSDPAECPGGHVVWQDFDEEVLGCRYEGYDSRSRRTGCDVWCAAHVDNRPVLKGLEDAAFHSASWLYRLNPLSDTATLLLEGRWSEDAATEPVAWTNTYKGGRVFYTALGHWEDFENPAFNRLLKNAIYWALGKDVP